MEEGPSIGREAGGAHVPKMAPYRPPCGYLLPLPHRHIGSFAVKRSDWAEGALRVVYTRRSCEKTTPLPRTHN